MLQWSPLRGVCQSPHFSTIFIDVSISTPRKKGYLPEKQEMYIEVLFDASTEAHFSADKKKRNDVQAVLNFHQQNPANLWAFHCHVPRCPPPLAHPSAAARAGLSAVRQHSAPSGGLHHGESVRAEEAGAVIGPIWGFPQMVEIWLKMVNNGEYMVNIWWIYG